MVSEEQNQQRHKKTSLLKLVRDPLFYKPIRVGCILMMIQQFSGIRKNFEIVHENKIINLKSEFRHKLSCAIKWPLRNLFSAVQFYSTIMFESAGMENPKLGTVIVGILKIVFTFMTIFIMNRFRRKLLMQVSLGIETHFRVKVHRSSGWNLDLRWI